METTCFEASHRRGPLLHAGVLVMLALFSGSCAAVTVTSYMDPVVGARPYRTFNWEVMRDLSTGDPRLDNNRFFRESVESAIEQQLTARGFRKSDAPDLAIHYHARLEQAFYVSSLEDPAIAYENGDPQLYDAGTLLIDVVDRTGRLLWRGYAQASVDPRDVDNQQLMTRRIEEAVARILATFPRAG
jgi:hypothetical protein